MAKNMLELRPSTPLEEKREAVLVLFIFLTSLLLSCRGKSCLKTETEESKSERTRRKRNWIILFWLQMTTNISFLIFNPNLILWFFWNF